MNHWLAPHAYRAFISETGFVINGCLFDYHVRGHDNLLASTANPSTNQIPYSLTLLDKQGQRLATGCVVFKATPVLDQVIALTLHVRDPGSEQIMLRTAQWSDLSHRALSDATLRDILGYDRIIAAVYSRVPRPAAPAEEQLRRVINFLERPDIRRFHHRRKRIMDCIERNVVATLCDLTGIPHPIYQFMRNPAPQRYRQRNRLAYFSDVTAVFAPQLGAGPGPAALAQAQAEDWGYRHLSAADARR